ncbi:NAD(+)/NADH kinase [Proteocatella sphenisci]|uniref:NAD(+)/NADH kinase n=1 Tax=Proteocatella sphenisci TaxID=181070 RepID=UPI00048BF231|nr:NAD(+)/NADH kinase [Proteocatella sphenisci]
MIRKIVVTSNPTEKSQEVFYEISNKLEVHGFSVYNTFVPDAELIIIIGGDGWFIKTIHDFEYPDIPIVGINTGHLGFLQDINPKDIDLLIENYLQNNYSIREIAPVTVDIYMNEVKKNILAINEVVIRGTKSRMIHLKLKINSSFIECFSGDGLIVSSPTGSTAYNYSAGGSIIDPSLESLQITPLSPTNTNAYRSFTSSIITAPDSRIEIDPEYRFESSLLIINDGIENKYNHISKVIITTCDKKIKILRLHTYDFWAKVTDRFL